jgi:hypothetical protein
MHRRKWILATGLAVAIAIAAALLLRAVWPNSERPNAFRAGSLITVCGELTGEIVTPPAGRTGTFEDTYSPGVLTLLIVFSSPKELILVPDYGGLTHVKIGGQRAAYEDEIVRVPLTTVERASNRCKGKEAS